MRISLTGRRRAALLVAGLGLVACGGSPAAPVEVDVEEDVEVDDVAAPRRVAAGGHM